MECSDFSSVARRKRSVVKTLSGFQKREPPALQSTLTPEYVSKLEWRPCGNERSTAAIPNRIGVDRCPISVTAAFSDFHRSARYWERNGSVWKATVWRLHQNDMQQPILRFDQKTSSSAYVCCGVTPMLFKRTSTGRGLFASRVFAEHVLQYGAKRL